VVGLGAWPPERHVLIVEHHCGESGLFGGGEVAGLIEDLGGELPAGLGSADGRSPGMFGRSRLGWFGRHSGADQQ
jgi:hypothetical protein